MDDFGFIFFLHSISKSPLIFFISYASFCKYPFICITLLLYSIVRIHSITFLFFELLFYMNIHVVIVTSQGDSYIMNRVRMIREQLNISQLELGLRVGIAQQEISLIENDKREDVTLRNAAKIAMALGETVEYLFPGYFKGL